MAASAGRVAAPGPDPPRPAAAPGYPRPHRRGPVPARAAHDSRRPGRSGRRGGTGAVVRADRAAGPGAPARAVTRGPRPRRRWTSAAALIMRERWSRAGAVAQRGQAAVQAGDDLVVLVQLDG